MMAIQPPAPKVILLGGNSRMCQRHVDSRGSVLESAAAFRRFSRHRIFWFPFFKLRTVPIHPLQSPVKLSMAGILYGFVFADGKEDNLMRW
jgi:hypothetical protein